MTNSLDQLRLSSMLLLGRALADLYPSAKLIGGGIDALGYYYDFFFEGEVNQQVFPLIEEKMRAWIQQDIPFVQSEMLQKNAVDFFTHHKRHVQAELLAVDLHGQRLIGIGRAGEFFDWVEGEMLPSAGGIGAFKLLDVVASPQEGWRVTGTAQDSKDSLKSFLKNLKNAQKHNHLDHGKKIGWLSGKDEELILLKKGIDRRREILLHVEKAFEEERFPPIAILDVFSLDELEEDLAAKVKKSQKIYTCCPLYNEEEELYHLGLFSRPWTHGCYGVASSSSDDFAEAMKSSLKLIVKTSKILGFEVSWTLSAAEVENSFAAVVRQTFEEWGVGFEFEACGKKEQPSLVAKVADLSGRRWKIASLRLLSKKLSTSLLQEGGKDGKNKGDKNLEERILIEGLASAERVMAFELEADSCKSRRD